MHVISYHVDPVHPVHLHDLSKVSMYCPFYATNIIVKHKKVNISLLSKEIFSDMI